MNITWTDVLTYSGLPIGFCHGSVSHNFTNTEFLLRLLFFFLGKFINKMKEIIGGKIGTYPEAQRL